MFFTMFTLEQEGQKSGGAMPPQSEKWRGHWPPWPPSCSAAYGAEQAQITIPFQ